MDKIFEYMANHPELNPNNETRYLDFMILGPITPKNLRDMADLLEKRGINKIYSIKDIPIGIRFQIKPDEQKS